MTLKGVSAVRSVLDRLVELSHIQSLETEHTPCMFCFNRIQLDFRYKTTTEEILASVIRYALREGLHIEELRLGRIERHTHRMMLLLSQNARQCVSTTECGGSPLGFMRMFLDSLTESATLGSYGASKDAFKSVCSSFLLPESAAIRRFECAMEDLWERGDFQDIRWFWLLYGLFSHHARHSITSLDIFARSIQANDMVRVRDFVSAPRPLGMMKNSDSETATSSSNPNEDFSHVVLANGAPVYSSDGNICVFGASDTTNTFDVMGVGAETVDILVRGFGHCKVKHVDVAPKQRNCLEAGLAQYHDAKHRAIRDYLRRTGAYSRVNRHASHKAQYCMGRLVELSDRGDSIRRNQPSVPQSVLIECAGAVLRHSQRACGRVCHQTLLCDSSCTYQLCNSRAAQLDLVC